MNYLFLDSGEWLLAVIRGAIMGIVAILFYFLKQRLEIRSNKQGFATILHGEISRMTNDHNNMSIRQRKPEIGIYQGLLNSGNLRFFPIELQNTLDDLYYEFRENPIDFDKKNARKVIGSLEEMIEYNKKHKYLFFSWMRVKDSKA